MDYNNIKSNFISEKTIEESRQKRQEEWEKARQENKDLPELKDEDYDPRTLYERLQEQRLKKEEAHREATKLGNLIHTIDDDEAAFLHSLKEKSLEKEKKIQLEEEAQLKEFKQSLVQRNQPIEPNPSKIADSNKEINWNLQSKKRVLNQKSLAGLVKKVKPSESIKSTESTSKSNNESSTQSSSPPQSIGLVQYDSDQDSDSD